MTRARAEERRKLNPAKEEARKRVPGARMTTELLVAEQKAKVPFKDGKSKIEAEERFRPQDGEGPRVRKEEVAK